MSSQSPEDIRDFFRFVRFCRASGNTLRLPHYERRQSIQCQGGWAEMSVMGCIECDADVMACIPGVAVFPLSKKNCEEYSVDKLQPGARVVFAVREKDVHPGYVRLIDKNTGKYCTRHELIGGEFDFIQDGGSEAFSGKSAVTWNFNQPNTGQCEQNVVDWINSFSHSVRGPNKLPRLASIDMVPSLPCRLWPDDAAEWVTRPRPHGWPPAIIIEKCVRTGCHFVGKSYNSSRNADAEFRYSFSPAELRLVRSWLPAQHHIYSQLKKIKGMINDMIGERLAGRDAAVGVLCSYHLKTLMFWSCENKPVEFWRGSVVTAAAQLLCELIEWLIERNCPHYFIPSNNLFDNLDEPTPLAETVDLLGAVCCNPMHLISELSWSDGTLLGTYSQTLLAYVRLIVPHRHFNTDAAYVLYDVYVALDACLSHILNGESGCPVADVVSIFRKAFDQYRNRDIVCLLQRLNMSVAWAFLVKDYRPWTKLFRRMLNPFRWKKRRLNRCQLDAYPDRLPDISNIPMRDSCTFLYTVPSEDFEQRLAQDKHKFELFADNRLEHLLITQRVGASRPPAWHCCKAHFANFLYAACRDYRSAITVCTEVIEQSKTDFEHVIWSMSDRLCAVHWSSDWAPLFDSDIQMLLGFVLLYDFVCRRLANADLDGSDVFVAVCPTIFAHYVKVRCLQNMKTADLVDDVAANQTADLIATTLNSMHRHSLHVQHYMSPVYALSDSIIGMLLGS